MLARPHLIRGFTCVWLLGLGITGATPAAVTDYVNVERVAAGLSRPVFVTAPRGDFERLFIVEQHTGRIEILDLSTGTIAPRAFLTLTGLATGNEQGLLGLAFHPAYASNGYFFVNYTAIGGSTRVVRFRVSASDPNVADPSSATTVLVIDQPQTNHNGGWIGFGPDGYLYVASGDGGGGNDDDAGHTAGTGNAQDVTNNLLGKLLRIDVNRDDFPNDPMRNYAIPPDNPFVGASADDEIWAFGLRNPWRASFDRRTGDLYIADVGQGAREEVNFQPAASGGGENYGWRLREGRIATPGSVGGPPPPDAVDPIYDYAHGSGELEGRSVTGGYVYRGPSLPLRGEYFLADFIASRVWSIRHDGATATRVTDWTPALEPDVGSIGSIASFGEDAAGNLYIVDLGGEVFRLAPVCRLELNLASDAGGVAMEVDLESDIPVLWSNLLLAGGDVAYLWGVPLPALPKTSLTVPLEVAPGSGTIGVLGLFSTPDGLVCAGIDFADTGPAP